MLQIDKNLELQVLRAYAVILVIIAHSGYLIPELIPYISFFWLGGGVDLFFCISGFIIATSLFKNENYSFRYVMLPFIIKRIFRLWPTAIFWGLVSILLSCFFLKYNFFSNPILNIRAFIYATLQIENIYIWFINAVEGVSNPSPIRVYWSLSLEEQFYFIFPIMLILLRQKIAVFIIALLVISQLFIDKTYPSLAFFFRTDALGLGILIAYLHHINFLNKFSPIFLKKTLIRVINTSCLLLLLFLIARSEIIYCYHGVVAIVSSILVYIASFNQSFLIKNVYIKKILGYIGDISYSLYLTHLIIFAFIKSFIYTYFESYPDTIIGIILLLIFGYTIVIVVSHLSFYFIEQPIRKIGREISISLKK